MEIIRILISAYLITTLSATAMAKLKNRRPVTVSIQRESVIPARSAAAFTLLLVIVEFSLATLLTFDIMPTATDSTAAAIFILFASYRVTVAVKTKSMTCSCSGIIQTDPASFPSVGGASFACLIYAALAFTLMLAGKPAGYPANLILVLAWISPPVGLVVGARRERKEPRDDMFTTEFLPLWTSETGRHSR